MITKSADTDFVPSASSVIVRVEFQAGFLTVNIEFTDVVEIMLISTMSDVRPRTIT